MGGPLAANWVIFVPVALGFVAIYLLLPQPRGWRPIWGILIGALAILLAGWLLIRAGAAPVEDVLFYIFAAVAVVSAAQLVTLRNPVHAALSFALVVLSTCGLFLLQAAPFLMAGTVIIYAGAIVVTFLFVIMLAQQAGISDADQRSREPALATIAGFVLLCTLLYVLTLTYESADLRGLDQHLAAVHQDAVRLDGAGQQPPAEGTALLDDIDGRLAAFHQWADKDLRTSTDSSIRLEDAVQKAQADVARERQSGQPDWGRVRASLHEVQDAGNLLRVGLVSYQPGGDKPLSGFSGPPPNSPFRDIRRDEGGTAALPAENVAHLGRALFTDYLLGVELAGTLLLVATIGAIAIAARRPEVLR